MIQSIAILLGYQLAGEIAARALGLSLPGPVLGFAALFLTLLLWPPLHAIMAPTARGLLAHLSLLFVPAGVGIVRHISSLGDQSLAVLAAIVASTALAIAAGATVFVLVDRVMRR
ncbi:MAG: CidA/LrgA family protein [Pseudomonadota bacterium]|nr:CidA/LrgA family protein [Pseudomonadota bacterium]